MKRFAGAYLLSSMIAMLIIIGCAPKELRTVKIEMGTMKKPRPNPDIERVRHNLNEAVAKYPGNGEVYQYLARLYMIEGKYLEMAEALNKADSLAPKLRTDNEYLRQITWKDLFEKGKYQATNQELEAALVSFKNSGAIWPERYESFINAAVVAHQLGDKEEAYKLSRHAFELAPDSLVVLENYATMCINFDKFAEAESAYNKIIMKDPTNAEIYFQLGKLAMMAKDTTRALYNYEKGVSFDSANPDGWFNIGLMYFQKKEYCRAADAFGHVVDLLPQDNESKINHSLSLIQCGRLEEARNNLEKFTTDNPTNCDGWDLLSQTYLRLKLQKEAQEAYKKYESCKGRQAP